MVTLVGTQQDFSNALKDLLELEYDAVGAYEAAINRLTNTEYKDKLKEFKTDHLRHIDELTKILKNHNEEAPTGADMTKQWLAKGKVVLANLINDEAILAAMVTNEYDTNTAYERMKERNDKWDDAIMAIDNFLGDEKRHKAWLENVVANHNRA